MGVVLFEPGHLQMVQGSPSRRRAFIDDMLRMLSPAYDEAYTSYYHVLYQRNVVLRKLRDMDLLDVYDRSLANYAAVILRERLKFLKRMAASVSTYYEAIAGEGEGLELRYKASFPWSWTGSWNCLLRKPETEARNGSGAGRTSIGPHLDDLSFLLNGEEAKKFASTGQIRSIVLAMKCMEIDRVSEQLGEAPVVLLDDVMSELDEKRRRMLLSMIRGQCIITAAEPMEALEEAAEAIDLIELKKSADDLREEDLW